MKIKKTLIASCLMAVMAAPSFSYAGQVIEMDRIVAIVNKTPITQTELNQRIAQVKANLEARKITLPPANVLTRQVLDQMELETLQLQFADSNGLQISDAELDNTIQRVAQQNKTTVEGLKANLAKQGLSFQAFKNNVRRELTLDRLREQIVASRVNVSDQEIAQVMDSAQYAHNTEYHLASIAITLPERADEKSIEKADVKIHDAYKALQGGKPFAQVATTYSDGSDALNGGDMGWRKASSLPAQLVTLLNGLKTGGFTDVIRTQNGFYIFQLIEKRDTSAPQMVEQYHVRHILIKTNEATSDKEAYAKIEQIRDRLLRGDNFQDLAKRYSQDGSASNGGDLGWLNKGDTVPAFEQAMLELKAGQVSQPVKTPFGWHLIQMVGSRTQDVSGDREKQAVRQEIRQRKAEQVYQDWLQQLKASAFIDDKLNDN